MSLFPHGNNREQQILNGREVLINFRLSAAAGAMMNSAEAAVESIY